MTHALTLPTSNLDKLINALRGYLASTPVLLEPAFVDLDPRGMKIDVQPDVADFTDPVQLITSVLLWCRNLDMVSATWQRTADAGSLHITVTGRLAGGTRMRIYKGVPYAACADLVRLDVGQSEGVSLDELHHLAGELRARQRRAAA